MSLRSLGGAWITLGLWVLAVGCSGGPSDAPKTVPVTGVVTYKGQPVPKLSVAFIPVGPGKLANGATDAAGKFSLSTNKPGDGAIAGSYKVAISFVPEEIPEMPGFPGSEKKVESPIPAKYGDAATSGLTQTVDNDPAKNDFKIELTD